MTMTNIKKDLIDLKNSVTNSDIPIEEIQRKLSVLLLSNCNTLEIEKLAKKLDNELELVIYTLKLEDQVAASLKIIDEAISHVENSQN